MGLLTEWCVLPDFCFGLVAVNTPHLWLPSITGQVVLAINIFPRLYFSEILCSLTVIRLISSVLNVGNKTMRPAEASFYWHLFRRVNEHFLTFFFRNIPLTIWGWHAVISKEKKKKTKRNSILHFLLSLAYCSLFSLLSSCSGRIVGKGLYKSLLMVIFF